MDLFTHGMGNTFTRSNTVTTKYDKGEITYEFERTTKRTPPRSGTQVVAQARIGSKYCGVFDVNEKKSHRVGRQGKSTYRKVTITYSVYISDTRLSDEIDAHEWATEKKFLKAWERGMKNKHGYPNPKQGVRKTVYTYPGSELRM